jgi:hypothetical protein
MSTDARMPRTINEFDKYIRKTTLYLESGEPMTNAERLGIQPTEVTVWKGFHTEWIPLCDKYNDITNSRTRAIKNNLRLIIDRAVNFDQSVHFLDRIAASPNGTIDDFGIFNINKGFIPKLTRSVPTTAITEPVTVTFQALGGGTIGIKCYSTTGKRAAIYGDANCVQFLFLVGTTPPTEVNENTMKKDISSKASFNLSLGLGNAGKNLYIYFRWFNSKHPELAGPWSALQVTMIL